MNRSWPREDSDGTFHLRGLSRRQFLSSTLRLAAVAGGSCLFLREGWGEEGGRDGVLHLGRVRGLMMGSFLGDALGGPIEFQPREKVQTLKDPPKVWADGERLESAALSATVGRLQLRGYRELRPQPESYAHWTENAAPGTITDDSRHKLILLHALRRASEKGTGSMDVEGMAQAFLDWPKRPEILSRVEYQRLMEDWLREWQYGARWVLGERDLAKARPPQRMWVGLPTCCGQMTSLPLAALYSGQPLRAYRAAHEIGFFDNGIGCDLNAGLVAGLAAAMATTVGDTVEARRVAWQGVIRAMRETDPYEYLKVPWTTRPVNRWMDLALSFADRAEGQPSRLFEMLEAEFRLTTKWEAQVPFVVAFGCLKICDFDPLAALQLSMEWGHDTDSYAQLVGAFVGAMYGEKVFRESWRATIVERLRLDYGFDFDSECQWLAGLYQDPGKPGLIRGV